MPPLFQLFESKILQHLSLKFNVSCAERIASVVASTNSNGNSTQSHPRIILVHGAGSFGHHQAKLYKISEGNSCEGEDVSASQYRLLRGVSETRVSLSKLSAAVLDNLRDAIQRKLDEGAVIRQYPVLVSPFGSWRTKCTYTYNEQCKTRIRHQEVTRDNSEYILDLLNRGYMPILHGN